MRIPQGLLLEDADHGGTAYSSCLTSAAHGPARSSRRAYWYGASASAFAPGTRVGLAEARPLDRLRFLTRPVAVLEIARHRARYPTPRFGTEEIGIARFTAGFGEVPTLSPDVVGPRYPVRNHR